IMRKRSKSQRTYSATKNKTMMKNKISLQEKLGTLREQRKALLATNFYNFETLQGVLEAAQAAETPIILQLTRSSLDYLGLPVAARLATSMLRQYAVEGW